MPCCGPPACIVVNGTNGALAQREKRATPSTQEDYVELSVHHDKIVNTIDHLKSHERGRASDAGEDREAIGHLLELTGLNKKAFSFVRSIDKLESDKRDDVLRSLHPLLDLMDKRWNGQSTADMFDGGVEVAHSDDFEAQLDAAAE